MKPTTWGMCCHLAALAGYLTGGLGCVVGPLIVWLVKKDSIPEVAEHGREAVNFNLTVCGAALSLFILLVVAFPVGMAEMQLVMLLMLAGAALHIVFIIVAATRAQRGESYRYPLTVRVVKA